MAFYFPEGTRLYFSNTLGTAKSITALSNANPAVATSAAHGFVDGDELLVNSGWGDIDEMVFKADQLTTDTFGLVDLNTTDTTFYPPGSGTGTAKKISTWVEVPQLLTLSTDGGDTRFTDVGLLGRRQDIRIPTGFNPSSMQMTLAWDPNQANFKAMLELSRSIRQCAMKIAVGGGAVIYGYGYLNVREAPAFNRNQVLEVSGALTMNNRPMSYAA
ncbi:MAG: phage tail tube protein [Burkholderiaceae bacterium]